MSVRKLLTKPVTILTLLTGLITVISLGGCPVQQQPTTPSDTDQQSQTPPASNNQRAGNQPRPIPPPVIDQGDDGGLGGSTGGGVIDLGGDSGGGSGGVAQPLSALISSPDASNINILPGGQGSITYEVFGGDPQDGSIKVELFYDADGVADTGDEIVLETGLPLRGTQSFLATGVAPGSYFIGIHANNNKETAVVHANGRLVVVGEPALIFNQPSSDVRARPSGSVPVQFSIESLANTVSYTVFVDVDNVVNGNETEAFSGGGLSGTGTIFLDNFAAGVYFIGATVTDSVGQSRTEYFQDGAGSFRTITVDLAPAIQVTQPTGSQVILPGDVVPVTVIGSDPEGAAVVTVFRDVDPLFNGNEATLQTFALSTPQATFNLDVDTTGLTPGTFRIGASISDGVGVPISAYAPGTIRINAPPTLSITSPMVDQQINSGQNIVLAWDADDPENKLEEIWLLVALDADADRIPDPGSEQAFLTAFDAGPNSNTFATNTAPAGRYMFGVRVVDDVDAQVEAYAPGIITVRNDTPTSIFLEPTAGMALRPGAQIDMEFTVDDRENLLLPQPLGIAVVLAYADENGDPVDLDGSGELDLGDLIHGEASPFFREGQNQHVFNTAVIRTEGLLDENGNGRFLLGVAAVDAAFNVGIDFAPGVLIVDDVVPQIRLLSPAFEADALTLDKIDALTVELQIVDTSPVTFSVLLDDNNDPDDGIAFAMIDAETWNPGDPDPVFTFDPLNDPDHNFPSGLFYYYLVVQDAVEPAVTFYAPLGADPEEEEELTQIRVRDRINGKISLAQLEDPNYPDGAILQGFNFNDLGGSAIAKVPDLTGDGTDEFVIVSRFGKPFIVNTSGVGFGEAYLVYGNANQRLTGAKTLNAVGRGDIPGIAFPGIRTPLNTSWTAGMSDVTVIPDMDGDELPEMVFSFPRVESLNLGVSNLNYQHPELFPDLVGMGNLEYNAIDPLAGWIPNRAQFTRGGIVIVSSHNAMIRNQALRNRKFDRVIDLHEVGQLFDSHGTPTLVPYIKEALPIIPPNPECRDCDMDPDTGDCDGAAAEVFVQQWDVYWDVIFNNQSPGGFHQPWNFPPTDPPLVAPPTFPYDPGLLSLIYGAPGPCDLVLDEVGCEYTNHMYVWGGGLLPFPCTSLVGLPSWDSGGSSVWTGFYGPNSTPFPDPATGEASTVGARILGQAVDDRFGTAVGSDGIWLYISAPAHTAMQEDVPALPDPGGRRTNSGVVYQFRTDSRAADGAPTRSQLWIEPGQFWPTPDVEIPGRIDVTMPAPHQYIIESVGSTRGASSGIVPKNFGNTCPPGWQTEGGQEADAAQSCYVAGYIPGTSGYYTDRTPQIVGPEANAELTFVRGIGDVNDDGINDFIVGSEDIHDAGGNEVGAIYIVHSRPTGLEGDYLLDRMALPPGDPSRLNGILLVGTHNPNGEDEVISRTFDSKPGWDFNGDGIDDVVIGNPRGANGRGEALVILGSRTLLSPEGGYTADSIVAEERAIRFAGVRAGDRTGANVSAVGDVDGDGYGDILISAPNAVDPALAEGNDNPGPGVAYLIYGSPDYTPMSNPGRDVEVGGSSDAGSIDPGGIDPTGNGGGAPSSTPRTVDLAQVGTVATKGIVYIGRKVGDFLGGGSKTVNGVTPAGESTTAYARGVAALGDIDGDGRDDYAIGSMLADPFGKTDAGEVYILYGRGDLLGQ